MKTLALALLLVPAVRAEIETPRSAPVVVSPAPATVDEALRELELIRILLWAYTEPFWVESSANYFGHMKTGGGRWTNYMDRVVRERGWAATENPAIEVTGRTGGDESAHAQWPDRWRESLAELSAEAPGAASKLSLGADGRLTLSIGPRAEVLAEITELQMALRRRLRAAAKLERRHFYLYWFADWARGLTFRVGTLSYVNHRENLYGFDGGTFRLFEDGEFKALGLKRPQ